MSENTKETEARKELLEILAEAEKDVENGRVSPVDGGVRRAKSSRQKPK